LGGVVVSHFDVIAIMPSYIFYPPANLIRKRKRFKYDGSTHLHDLPQLHKS